MGNKNSRSSSSANSSTSSPPTSNDASSSSSTPSGKSARLSKVASKKVTLEDFALLTTVGKGSFGRVIQVREKKTGKIYAMKVLRKNHVIRRKQYEHTMTERRILEEIDHPFIVSLHFAFQSSTKLYLVVNYYPNLKLLAQY